VLVRFFRWLSLDKWGKHPYHFYIQIDRLMCHSHGWCGKNFPTSVKKSTGWFLPQLSSWKHDFSGYLGKSLEIPNHQSFSIYLVLKKKPSGLLKFHFSIILPWLWMNIPLYPTTDVVFNGSVADWYLHQFRVITIIGVQQPRVKSRCCPSPTLGYYRTPLEVGHNLS